MWSLELEACVLVFLDRPMQRGLAQPSATGTDAYSLMLISV